jgi:L-fuculose-phosphate aldolase
MKHELEKKKLIIKFAKKLNSTNLSPLRSGNISIRHTKKKEKGFLITPSGMKYDQLRTSDIVFVSLKGKYNKRNKPSSEWHFHKDIYLNKKNMNAIVHSHSKSAVTLACLRKKIPAFHYMVAVAGGIDIRCAKYATFGTITLSKHIIRALRNRRACLIENHGQVATEKTISAAFELAQEVEHLSSQYINCLRIGSPKILSKSLMSKVLGKIKNYKKEENLTVY